MQAQEVRDQDEDDVASWAPEVQTAGDGEKWSRNALRFADKKDAEEWVEGLAMRWAAVTNTRVVPTDEEANR